MIIDAREKNCPIPVIMAKKQIEKSDKGFSILIDGKIQYDNLKKLAGANLREINMKKHDNYIEALFSDKKGTYDKPQVSISEKNSWAVFFNKEILGNGSNELGKNLAKMAIFTLSQSDKIPDYILFMNGGVKLLCGDNTQIIDSVNDLISRGCKVLVCGTCLDYFGLKESLGAGEISNMYDIISAMQNVTKVITM